MKICLYTSLKTFKYVFYCMPHATEDNLFRHVQILIWYTENLHVMFFQNTTFNKLINKHKFLHQHQQIDNQQLNYEAFQTTRYNHNYIYLSILSVHVWNKKVHILSHDTKWLSLPFYWKHKTCVIWIEILNIIMNKTG